MLGLRGLLKLSLLRSVVAARLANAGQSVLLLEAGSDGTLLTEIPAAVGATLGSSLDWWVAFLAPPSLACHTIFISVSTSAPALPKQEEESVRLLTEIPADGSNPWVFSGLVIGHDKRIIHHHIHQHFDQHQPCQLHGSGI